jgi:hypothetical protein
MIGMTIYLRGEWERIGGLVIDVRGCLVGGVGAGHCCGFGLV